MRATRTFGFNNYPSDQKVQKVLNLNLAGDAGEPPIDVPVAGVMVDNHLTLVIPAVEVSKIKPAVTILPLDTIRIIIS